MKRLHELFSFFFYISGLITYIGRVSWMIYITCKGDKTKRIKVE